MPTILVIDDNRAVSTALEVLFSLHDIDTLHAESPEAGLALLREQPVDLVIQDMNFTQDTTSGAEGERLFADIRMQWPDMPVILLTAWTHLEVAVNLVKAGAADYIAKPWDDRKLLATVNTLLELAEARSELERRRSRERRGRERAVHDQQPLEAAAMRAGKLAEFERLRAEYRALRDARWAGDTRYDAWINAPMNNAKLLPFGLYDQWVPAFAALFAEVGGDWSVFYQRVEAWGRLPFEQRQQALKSLAGVAG